MKKHLPAILSCMLLTSAAYAQSPITLTSSNVPDTLNRTDVISNVLIDWAVPGFAAATNANWDLSLVTYKGTYYNAEYATDTGFTNAPMSNLVVYKLTPTQQYNTKLMFAVTSAGNKIHGERIKRQAFSLGTANPNDSLVILAQDVVYDQPQVQFAYPATMSSTWSSTSKSTTKFVATYNPLITNAPGEVRATLTSSYKVIGWGNVKAKHTNNKVSANMPVLQIESTTTTTDSFYINGSPAPGVLLAQAGITQGETRSVYQRNFYRIDELTPLVSATYTDATFTTLQDVNIHRERLKLFEDNVEELYANKNVSVYPNPVIGQKVSVKLENVKAGNWTYELINIEGKKIAQGSLNMNSGIAKLDLPASATNGFYYITISCNGAKEAVKPLIVQ